MHSPTALQVGRSHLVRLALLLQQDHAPVACEYVNQRDGLRDGLRECQSPQRRLKARRNAGAEDTAHVLLAFMSGVGGDVTRPRWLLARGGVMPPGASMAFALPAFIAHSCVTTSREREPSRIIENDSTAKLVYKVPDIRSATVRQYSAAIRIILSQFTEFGAL